MNIRPRILASTIATILTTALPVLSPNSAYADLHWYSSDPTNTWVNDGFTFNWMDADLELTAWTDNQRAIFGDAGETVTINSPDSPIVAAGLRFESGGYTIAGTGSNGTLTLGAPDVEVVNEGTNTTISAIIAGTAGLRKTGAGMLTLSGNNSFSGGLTLDGGITRLTGVSAFTGGITINAGATLEMSAAGANSATYNSFLGAAANGLIFDGGTYRANASADRTLASRNVTINSGGATFDILGTLSNFVESGVNNVRFDSASSFSGTGTLTKNGGGRLGIYGSSPNFSGPVVINDGTIETGGAGLGNASATNTITVNGGILAMNNNFAQNITLNGGALTATGGNRTVTGSVGVTANSYIFLNEFWRDFDSANPNSNLARNATIEGQLTGTADLGVAVNRTGYRFNSGALVLKNPANNFSGTITVGKNLRLENNPTGGSGKTLGTASVVLADGGLTLRDNGTGSGATLDYGNDVSVTAPTDIFDRGTLSGAAYIDVNRASGSNTGNVFKLGGLTLGDRPLTVQGGNGYGVEFGGTSQLTADATLNATTAPVTFSGALGEDAAGRGLTKTGAAALNFTGDASFTGTTVINSGAVTVGGTAGRLSGTSGITLSPGTSLHVDNSASNLADRISNTASISMTGAALTFSSQSGAAVNGAETVGAVTLVGGTNTITVNQGNAGAVSALTLASLTRQNDAILRIIGTNLGQTGNGSRIVLANQATDLAFLGAWVTVGNEFARYVATSDANGVRGITAVDSLTDPADDSAFTAATHLRLTANTTTSLTSDRSLNTVNFANTADTATLALGANKLTLAGGGILVGTNAAEITATTGSLTSGTPDLIITNHAALNIGAAITDNGSTAVGLHKTGAGDLTLSGQNTYTGDTVVDEGTLTLGSVASLGSGGTLRLSNGTALTTLRYTGASASTDHPVTIGAPGAFVNVTTANQTLTLDGPVNGSSLTVQGVGALAFGGTTTITGDLDVATGAGGASGILRGVNGGTLSVGSGSSNRIHIGVETTALGVDNTGLVDLSGLSSFSANVGSIRVSGDISGINGTGINRGTLILPANNTIVASTSIVVADSINDGAGSLQGTLTFGSGTNNVTTPLLTIGGRKYSGTSTIANGGTLILGNGASGTTLNVGANTTDTGTAPTSTLNLTGGTIQANLAALTIAHKNGGGANGKTTATVNLGTSATTEVNISHATSSAVRIGLLEFSNGSQPVNERATGTLTVGGGKLAISSASTTSSPVVIGHFNATTAISGTTANPTPNNAAVGTLTINGGEVTVNSSGSASAINLGAHTIPGTSVGTNTSSGTLNLNGGSLTVNNRITGNSGNASSTSTLNVTGGTLNMQGNDIRDINNLAFSGGTIRDVGTLNRALTQTGEGSLLDVSANNTNISGSYGLTDGEANIAPGRTLAVGGTGTTLSGTATLTVNGSITGSLLVNAGATVTGSGTTGALTLAGGTLEPGNSAGIVNTGDLSLGGGTLSLELNGTAAGTGYDQINVTGSVSLSANTAFTLTLGFTPAINTSFVLISNDGSDAISGAGRLVFGGVTLNEGAIFDAGGSSFRISYAGGVSNNDIVLQTVPEPSTAAVLFGGIGALLGLRRFGRRSR